MPIQPPNSTPEIPSAESGRIVQDIDASEFHSGESQVAADLFQDPRMRFRTTSSFISLLEKVLDIKDEKNPKAPLDATQRAQPRALAALANLFVRGHEVTAVVGSPQLQALTNDSYAPDHILIAQNPRDIADTPSQVSLLSPEGLSDPKRVLTYLVEAGPDNDFNKHAELIIQFVNALSMQGSLECFQAYVIATSAVKMHRRINHSRHSMPYFNAITELSIDSVEWVGGASPPNSSDRSLIELLQSELGTKFFKEVPADFPNLRGLTTKSRAIYTKNTFREFHKLLRTTLVGYRNALKALVKLQAPGGKKPKKPTTDELEKAIDCVSIYLAVLSHIAYSAAAADHLSKFVKIKTQNTKVDSSETEGETGASEDDAIPASEGPGASVRVPSRGVRWIRLQVVQIKSLDHLRNLYCQSGTLPSSPVMSNLQIHTISPPLDTVMAPLAPVVKGVIARHGKGLHYVNINLKTVSAALEELRIKFGKSPRFFTEPLENLYNGTGFSGRVHCEAALATLIFNDSKPTAIQYDKTAIGTSKRCCPTCSELLEALSSKLEKPTIRTIGSHRTSTPYALPDDLSSDLVKHMLEESEKKLMIRLRDLCLTQLHSHQDSIGGDSPPSPRSPDSDPLSGDEMILGPVEDD